MRISEERESCSLCRCVAPGARVRRRLRTLTARAARGNHARAMVSRASASRAAKHCYEWPRPSVTADVALLALRGGERRPRLEVLLIQRGRPPFEGSWALPGGFVDRDEDLPAAAARELAEETGVEGVRLEQVGVIGTPGRDPRGHTVTALYVAGFRDGDSTVSAGDDAADARWFPIERLPALAFDHGELVTWTMLHVRDRLGRAPWIVDVLPRSFSRAEAAALWSAAGFRSGAFGAWWRVALVARTLVPVIDGSRTSPSRPRRYRFDRRALARLDPLAPRAGR